MQQIDGHTNLEAYKYLCSFPKFHGYLTAIELLYDGLSRLRILELQL
uniref:Uncharacterized protein n=1 Tax=Rhizophora mucronata TaxID=61149 RepID=A0A2P2NIJ2_RHIMU